MKLFAWLLPLLMLLPVNVTLTWAADATTIANKADVLKDGLTGVWMIAVHEVTDTGGKKERQVYSVLNHVASGQSFIVISSDNSEVSGVVYLIKGNTLYAAAANQRSFNRLGGLNLDRRISGSLFSHWDLQGNIPLGKEYAASLLPSSDGDFHLACAGKDGSHYAKIQAIVDGKSNLMKTADLFDSKGLLKTATYAKPKTMGNTTKRRIPTQVVLKRAADRSDLAVPETSLVVYEIEFNPNVNYDDMMSVSDANLQRLRSKYVLNGERYRSILSEAAD